MPIPFTTFATHPSVINLIPYIEIPDLVSSQYLTEISSYLSRKTDNESCCNKPQQHKDERHQDRRQRRRQRTNNLHLFAARKFVTASYSGGHIVQGYLVGIMEGDKLKFSYCQIQHNDTRDNGQSECELTIENDKIHMAEHFEWASRSGEKGVNVFREL